MGSTFWYTLALCFIVGSAWVTLDTVIAERYGSRLGGIFAGFPMMLISTLVITCLAGGVDFSRAMRKAIMVSATVNVPL